MATETLRPNATTSAAEWTRTGGTTKHGVLADDSDATYLTKPLATEHSDDPAIFALTTYTLAAGERVKRARVRVRASSSSSAVAELYAEYDNAPSPPGYGTVYCSLDDGTTPATFTGGWTTSLLSVASQQAAIDGLYGTVRGVVSTNQPRAYELYIDLDVWARTDAPTVSSPSGTITDTDVPTIESYTAALNDGTPSLWSREVRVFRDAVYGAGGFDPETETDVEWEDLDANFGGGAGRPPSTSSSTPDEIQVGEPLANSDTYRAYVRYGKNDVAGETLWSEWDYAEFTLDLTLPTAPGIAVEVDQPAGRQVVTVTTAAATHDTVERIRVERSDDEGDFETIRGGLITADPDDDSALAGSTAYTFEDHDAPRGVALVYRARVTEGITASGTTLTSSWTTASPVAHPNDGHTWLYDVDAFDHVGPYRVLRGVTRAPSEQSGVFHPLGRRTAVVVTAGRGPDQIAFDVLARDHHGDVDDVEALLTSTRRLLVKWPEGTQDYVRVTSRSFDYGDMAGDRRRNWSVQTIEVDSGITADG